MKSLILSCVISGSTILYLNSQINPENRKRIPDPIEYSEYLEDIDTKAPYELWNFQTNQFEIPNCDTDSECEAKYTDPKYNVMEF